MGTRTLSSGDTFTGGVYSTNVRGATESTMEYWESRYATGGNSGLGSRGRLGRFKSDTINDFLRKHNVEKVIEFGCGDGEQLSQCRYPSYQGFDVSFSAVELCRARFAGDTTKSFDLLENFTDHTACLTVSLDVIYHLVDDVEFDAHLENLFTASRRYVIIYSSDYQDDTVAAPRHIRHRAFSRLVKERYPDWHLRSFLPNRFPFTGNHERESFSDFYMYEHRNPRR